MYFGIQPAALDISNGTVAGQILFGGSCWFGVAPASRFFKGVTNKMSIASENLRNAYNLINQPSDFEVGDLVTWKDPCMKNATLPKDCNSFGIVVRFEEPTRASDSVGSNQYSDFKDMVIGVIDEDGDYSEFTAASRRMKKFVE